MATAIQIQAEPGFDIEKPLTPVEIPDALEEIGVFVKIAALTGFAFAIIAVFVTLATSEKIEPRIAEPCPPSYSAVETSPYSSILLAPEKVFTLRMRSKN
jgi:hypothetical protein